MSGSNSMKGIALCPVFGGRTNARLGSMDAWNAGSKLPDSFLWRGGDEKAPTEIRLLNRQRIPLEHLTKLSPRLNC